MLFVTRYHMFYFAIDDLMSSFRNIKKYQKKTDLALDPER